MDTTPTPMEEERLSEMPSDVELALLRQKRCLWCGFGCDRREEFGAWRCGACSASFAFCDNLECSNPVHPSPGDLLQITCDPCRKKLIEDMLASAGIGDGAKALRATTRH